LRHTIRIALRDHLLNPEIATSDSVKRALTQHPELLAGAALGAPTPEAAAIVVARLQQAPHQERHAEYLQFAARYADGRLLERLIEPLRAASASDPQAALSDLLALAAGLDAAGIPPRDVLGDWPAELAQRLLGEGLTKLGGWTSLPVPGRASDGDVFVVQMRPSADGDAGSAFFCSLPGGEQKTGVYRSAEFAIPERITFFMAGHNGFPTTPVEPNNAVRLRDARTGEVVAEALPPRNDMAQHFEWDLKSHSGRRAVIEITDSDTRDAYAWLAVGRFSIPDLNPEAFSPLEAATRLIARLQIAALRSDLAAATADANIATPTRVRCADALLSLEGDARLSALLPGVAAGIWPATLGEQTLILATTRDESGIETALTEAMRQATAVQQRQMAEALAGDRRGAEALLKLIESGRCSARLLIDTGLQQKLSAALGPDSQARIHDLTAGLPTASEAIDTLIAQRRAGFTPEGTTTERGRALFKQHCAACHQLGAEGKQVGPRLDGIGLRGTDRLLEDLLDPSRNVDAAFRTTTIVTGEGVVVSGLKLREEGAVLVLANNKGEEVLVPMDDIDEQALSTTSLMPANFGELLPPQDLNELVSELLRQKEPVPQRDSGSE
jgi:putative heme-binding domain-containing protein